MKVELTAVAKKRFQKLPRHEAQKVARKLLSLETAPFSGKKLQGKLRDRYSLKSWPYRIIYVVELKRKTVQIETIEHRQGVY